jgi:site-specific DNA recombinase
VPLGYRVEARALRIVEEHADVIRSIFARYLELGSVLVLQRHLMDGGIHVPLRTDGAGRVTGGKPFSRGHLYKILSNPIYAGRLAHKGRIHDGQHAAIVETETWDGVAAMLAANAHGHKRARLASAHLLTSRIRDAEGRAVSPTHAQKGSVRYRYYVSRGSPALRIPASTIKMQVLDSLRASLSDRAESDADLIATYLKCVIVHPDLLELRLSGDREPIIVPWRREPSRRRRDIVVPPSRAGSPARPMKTEDRARILKAIATGRAWMEELVTARMASTAAIASREVLSERSVRMTLSLAQLAPTIVRAIVDGRLPRGIGIRDLSELPVSWLDQERALGLA